ncbi:PGF-CTERM sorting domain-containing protein [Halorubrum halophilum]|uniref:PGF-CTERM sorting domain-containing protein n=1 Tax=Halorubrum halophilum TaxID=413816 RepID=UPI00186AC379|nr:PGF-CTERM sorting domain-containing protein [Halorubrum halophilum]
MKFGSKTAVALSVILVLSMLAPPVVAQTKDDIPDDETFTTNNVEVWEESIFTLRHDFEDAPTAVKTGDFRAGLGSGGDASLNRKYLGVRTAGDEVTLGFDSDRSQLSSADLSGNNVQVIAARVTGSGESVTTFTEATDLISQENANSNATFEEVESDLSLSSGKTTFTHTGDAGHYAYFVVDKETGEFNVDSNGDIKIASGTPTIVGVEQITFQRGSPAAVSAPAIAEPGDDLSFELNTTNQFAKDNVNHAVLVYDESTFSDINKGKFTIEVSDRSEIDENFNLSEDAELFHKINEVNGVANVEDGIKVNGIDISDGRVSRAVGLGSVVDFVAEDIDGNAPDTTATGNVRLNASVTADAQRDRNHSLTVETKSDWETGTYRYIYVGALADNASAVTTSTGTVSIQESAKTSGQSSDVVESTGKRSLTVNGNTVEKVDFDGLKPGTTASVTELTSSYVTATPSADNTRGYFEINADTATRGGSATVEMTFKKSRFSNPNNAQVFRYNTSTGKFNELTTTQVGETSTTITLQFKTGFSLFAVGESSSGGNTGGTTGNTGGGGTPSATFTVSDLSPQDIEVTQGEEITVTATVTTDRWSKYTKNVELRVGGDTVATQSVSLEDQQSTTVEFTGIDTSNLEGEYEYGVFTDDSSQTATLTVTVPSDDDTGMDDDPSDDADQDDGTSQDDDQATDDDADTGDADTGGESEDGTPGFGVLVAVIALIAGALIATRQN